MSDVYRLGASMYVPCNHPELSATFSGQKFPSVRSLIACTEDSISADSVSDAIIALSDAINSLPPKGEGPMRFIRCRNVDVLEAIMCFPHIRKVDGFVLPKVDEDVLPDYERVLKRSPHYIMPTLETLGVFDLTWQACIRGLLSGSPLRDRILVLRIGGNDLLRHLGLRRVRGVTAYETPLGALIQQLVLSFRPHGFQLTAPVYDYFEDPATLRREVQQDVRMGLVGKTAIHPVQAKVIDDALRVSKKDLDAAQELLSSRGEDAAVFQHDGGMMEVKVHSTWAHQTIARAILAGTSQ